MKQANNIPSKGTSVIQSICGRAFAVVATALMTLAVGQNAAAQTLNVETGGVTYAFDAAETGDMTFTGTQTISIEGRDFEIDDISRMYVTDDEVEANTVSVTYADDEAQVVIAGNLAPYLTASVNGGHVAIVADESLDSEVTYTLSGASADGSFYMDGRKKATFILNGLTLENPDSAAVNIQCGKLINMLLADGTTNSLTDGLRAVEDDGSDAHKAALFINGHSEWSGTGALVINGNVKHGFFGDEYVLLGSNLGSITVASAPQDGLHVKQYLRMQGGTVNITARGDGIDVSATKDETDEYNGQLFIEGGTLTVLTTGEDVKGMKCDAQLTISGGTTSITATGDGSKGISSTGALTVSGGTTTVVTTGAIATIDGDEKKPHGVKSDADITLSGGTIYVAAGADGGKAFNTDTYIYTNGATVMGIGGKATTPSTLSTHTYNKYKDVKVVGGSTISYDGIFFAVPAIYSNASAKILTSK